MERISISNALQRRTMASERFSNTLHGQHSFRSRLKARRSPAVSCSVEVNVKPYQDRNVRECGIRGVNCVVPRSGGGPSLVAPSCRKGRFLRDNLVRACPSVVFTNVDYERSGA